MPVSDLQLLKNISTASYATNVPNVVLWTGLLVKIVRKKAIVRLWIAICILMIVASLAVLADTQLVYTFSCRYHDGVLENLYSANQTLQACQFIGTIASNLAGWFFAFSYLAISY